VELLRAAESTDTDRELGSNLRHDVAHGLVNDAVDSSVLGVYAWGLTFKLVMIPFWNQATGTAAPDPDEGDADSALGDE